MKSLLKTTESRTIRLEQGEIVYTLKRSNQRRRIGLSIDETGLTVSVPWRTSERRINNVLTEAREWIAKKLEIWCKQQPRQIKWRQGEIFRFLGREVSLDLVQCDNRTGVTLRGDQLQVMLADPSRKATVQSLVIKWYQQHARLMFARRIEHYAALLKLPAPRFFLSNAKTRWGSCNVRGDIRLNWRLIQAPPLVIDYVVVHELVHLIELSHSRRFWRYVASTYPDYVEAKSELSKHTRWYMEI